MNDEAKTKTELAGELARLRQRLSELEQAGANQSCPAERIAAINECFLEFGLDPNENIQRLTVLCGELMGADCALYNRIDDGLLFSAGQWQTPVGYDPRDKPEGHICYDVIKSGDSELFHVRGLQETPYYETDPNVSRYGLSTYIGRAVRCGRDYVGSLCMVFRDDFTPTDGDRRLMGIVASAIGVEEERRKSEELLTINSSAIEASINAFAITDHNAVLTFVNPSFLKLWGYGSDDEVLGRPLLDFWEEPCAATEVVKALNEAGQWLGDLTAKKKGGTLLDVQLSANTVKDRNGRITHMVASFMDVTDRKRAEEALAVRVERLKRLSELSMKLTGDPMDVFTKIARIISELFDVRVVCLSEVRGPMLHFLAVYADGEVITDAGESPIDVTPCATVKDAKDMRTYDCVAERFPEAEFLKEHDSFYYCGFPAVDGAGDVVAITCLLDDKAHDLSDEDKSFLRIFGQRIGMEFERRKMLSDRARAVKEKEELQSQLIQAQKMEAIGTLAGGIAHDFNNIMTVIRSLTSLALKKAAGDHKYASYLEPMREVSERGTNLVQQLLIFSQNKPVEFSCLNVNDVVDGFMKIIPNIIGEDISIVKELQHGLWEIKADRGRIEQVLTNLVINSRDSLLMGGTITLRTENITLGADQAASMQGAGPGDFIRLTVQDNGKGMDSDTIEHIFEPFFTTKAPKGTGLGLSVVYGIVKELNGWINVASKPGKGSTFMVYLPISAGSEKAVKETPAGREPRHGDGRRILLVEDDMWVRKSTAMVLSENGYSVFEASSAEQAIGLFYKEKGRFDLVMSDVVMPGRSGLQLVGPLLDINPSISILLCSGHLDDKAQLEQIVKRGIAYIQKPYEIDDLLRAVEEVIDEDSKTR